MVEKASLWVTTLQAREMALRAAGRQGEMAGPARNLSGVLRTRALQGPEAQRDQFRLLLADAVLMVPDPTPQERDEARANLEKVSAGEDCRRLLSAAARWRKVGDEARVRAIAERVLAIARPDQGLFVGQARALLGGPPSGPPVRY